MVQFTIEVKVDSIKERSQVK